MRRLAMTVAVAALALLSFAGPASAYPFGDLDASFGSNGIASLVPPGTSLSQAQAIAVQPDGKIIVAGGGDAPYYAWVARLTPGGALDPTFGTAGIFNLNQLGAGANPQIYAVKVQPDGKILLAGSAHFGAEDQLVARLNPDGTLDTGTDSTPGSCFGSGCIGYVVSTAATGDSDLTDVAVVANGDVLVAGTYVNAGNYYLIAHRFDSSGAPDSTFNTNASAATGTFQADVGDPVHVRLLLDPAGHYVFAAASKTGQFTAIKLNTDGTIVNGYGSGGTASLGTTLGMYDAIIDSSGRVTFSGAIDAASPSFILTLGRLDANGVPDGSFGTAGISTFNPSGNDRSNGNGLRQLSDGRLLVLNLSFTSVGTKPYPLTVVFQPNGQPDTSYGTGGIKSYAPLGENTYPNVLELGPRDQGLIGGVVTNSAALTFTGFVARIHGPNDPDPIVPTSKISKPNKSKTAARKLMKFSGTAAPLGQIAKVEIAVRKIDSKLLKKKKQCLWLSSSKAKFKKVKAVQKQCTTPRWLTATGTATWSYKLKRKLPKGSYSLTVRATATDGNVQATPTVKKFKIT